MTVKKIIVANWKMNPASLKEALELFSGVLDFSKKQNGLEVVICPPFLYIETLSKKIESLKRLKNGAHGAVKLGGQDIFWENKGAYTGELSGAMLKNAGAGYVIVGHSERRKNFNETEEVINKKIKAALKNNLKVIFCVGEEKRDEMGDYLKFVKNQIMGGLNQVSRKDLKNILITYEPLWTISSTGGGRVDTPEDMMQMTLYIKKVLFFKFGRKMAEEADVLYGGSVTDTNILGFLENAGVRGALVGRASLDKEAFARLLKKAL